MSSVLFVTGTDTGVGKTLVTTLLAMRLRFLGVDAGVMKPFASGCVRRDGVLEGEDALFLRHASGVGDSLDLINPIRLEEPLAPLTAARRAGLETANWFSVAREALEELRARHDYVVVEGVGGLMAPLAEEHGRILTCLDLVNRWSMPSVLVARRTLGTINHTLLTCATPLQAPAYWAGMVFCDSAAVDAGDVAAETSPDLVAEMTQLPIMGRVPYLAKLDAESLSLAAGSIEVSALLKAWAQPHQQTAAP